MHFDLTLKQIKKEYHGSFRSYVIGFFTSLFLTCLSFLAVIYEIFPPMYLIHTIVGLAILQAAVQLIFFLHLGQEASPRWETMIFLFMVLILLIIALGSLWIMYDLEERTMRMNMNMNKQMEMHK